MKCRGFTLIELLAVIVILAIIFLISAPIILNTVNKSKEEAEQESARSYVAVIKEKITKAMVEYPELKPSNSLNVEVNGTDDTSLKSWDCSNCGTTNKIEFNYKGPMPNKVNLTWNEGEITGYLKYTSNCFYVDEGGNIEKITKSSENEAKKFCEI